MGRWRALLTGRKPPPRPKRDTAKTRYFAHIRAGSTEAGAVKLVADSYGLPVYQTGPGGPDWTKPLLWTLEQIEDLLFLRWMHEHGRMGGPDR